MSMGMGPHATQAQEQNAVEELTRTMQEFENERTRMLRVRVSMMACVRGSMS